MRSPPRRRPRPRPRLPPHLTLKRSLPAARGQRRWNRPQSPPGRPTPLPSGCHSHTRPSPGRMWSACLLQPWLANQRSSRGELPETILTHAWPRGEASLAVLLPATCCSLPTWHPCCYSLPTWHPNYYSLPQPAYLAALLLQPAYLASQLLQPATACISGSPVATARFSACQPGNRVVGGCHTAGQCTCPPACLMLGLSVVVCMGGSGSLCET